MAREILFRGKRTDNGEWVDGSLLQSEATVGGHTNCEIVGRFAFANDIGRYKVDPSTIGQYTGLTDKNGVKIWEGDILIVPGGAWGIVVWKAPFFEVTISETESSLYSREWLQECEVFGNRFDNPELMQS